MSRPRTRITEKEFAEIVVSVRKFLKKESSITNRTLRVLTGLNYDQAISFFNIAVTRGVLRRSGRGSATHYTLLQ
jgi:hypothetical protein